VRTVRPLRLARPLADEHDVNSGREHQACFNQLDQGGHVSSPFRDHQVPVEATALWRRPPCGGDRPVEASA